MNEYSPANKVVKRLEITNKRGLHARASTKFAHTCGQFQAQVNVSKGGEVVSGASIIDLLTLGAAQGSWLQIIAEGEEAVAVVLALEQLLKNNFGEGE